MGDGTVHGFLGLEIKSRIRILRTTGRIAALEGQLAGQASGWILDNRSASIARSDDRNAGSHQGENW